MLFFIIFLTFFAGFLPLKAAENTSMSAKPNLNWITELDRQAKTTARIYEHEAKQIIDRTVKSGAYKKQCKVAKGLVLNSKTLAQKALRHPSSSNIPRYPKLLVFVSFSMPIEVLKELGTNVNQAGGKLVLRGLVQGSFKQTAQKIKALQETIIIDPTLFNTYQIKVVPTFVLKKDENNLEDEGPYDRLSGNISLRYALERFIAEGETAEEATTILEKIRGLS